MRPAQIHESEKCIKESGHDGACIFSKECCRGKHSSGESCWQSFRSMIDKCECGSTRLEGVICPDTKKYFDLCLECGDGGSHLCGHTQCPSNKDPETEAADNEVKWGYNHPECLDSAEAVLRSMVNSGACPNCYSFGHKDCSGDDEQCKTCEHDKAEHCLDNSACQYSDCECSEFIGE